MTNKQFIKMALRVLGILIAMGALIAFAHFIGPELNAPPQLPNLSH